MKPFDAPANANTPPVAPLLWFQWPIASCAAAIDVATYQVRCWADLQEAALDLSRTFWGMRGQAPAGARDADASPVISLVAADMAAASAALLQAQMDAIQAFRRSA